MGSRTAAAAIVAGVVIAIGGGMTIASWPGGDQQASAGHAAGSAHLTAVDAAHEGLPGTRDGNGPLSEPRSERRSVTQRGPRAGEVPSVAALNRRHVPDEVAAGHGTFSTIPGTTQRVGHGPVRTFAVEIEDGLAIDAQAFADEVERILLDPRGWTADGAVALQRSDGHTADLRVTLASPATVDEHCYPLETAGRFSCWNGERAMLNAWRWVHGASAFGDDLAGYRAYLVSHEVGHALGRGHVDCPAPGAPAPVMMQQTIGVEPCAANPWPYPRAGP